MGITNKAKQYKEELSHMHVSPNPSHTHNGVVLDTTSASPEHLLTDNTLAYYNL